jgi:Icc-related predicted phosphoesterase
MSKVTILHLSDLHIDSESDNLAKKLIKDVELLQDNYHHLQGNSGAPKIEKIDVIAVTGDIANKPSTNNYNAAIKFLNTLSEKLKTEKSNIVLVPGNHDVSWESRDFTGRFSHYGDFIRNFYDSENKLLLNTAAERHDSLYPLTINEQKILFIGLNSAVNVSKNKPNKGGELKVADLQKIKEDVNKKYKEYTRRIALFHHSCFRQKDDHDAIENWSSIKKDIEDLGIEMILHGHLHRGDMEQWITLKEERKFLITSTGSCKTGGLKESNADLYQYQIIVLDGNEKVYLYRRRFDRKDISNKWDGEWVADSDKEGRWCYSITPGTPGKQWEIDAPPYDIKKFLFGNTIPQNIMLSYHCSQSSPEEEPTFATLINLLSKHNVTFTTHQAPGKEPGEGFDFSKDEKIDQNIKEYLKHSHIFCIDSGGYNCYTQAMLQMVLKQRMKNIGVSFAWLPGMKEKAHNLNKQVEFQQVLIDGIYGYSAYEDGT